MYGIGMRLDNNTGVTGRRSALWDALLFGKLQKVLGGKVNPKPDPPTPKVRNVSIPILPPPPFLPLPHPSKQTPKVKIFLSGAAPLSADLHRFLKVAFNAPVVQGYGLTENAGAVKP